MDHSLRACLLHKANLTKLAAYSLFVNLSSFFICQNTRIDLGLQKAHTDLFSPYYGGARPDVKKLAFILTDGKQNPKGQISLKHAAGKLINDDIKTISIGIGSKVRKCA